MPPPAVTAAGGGRRPALAGACLAMLAIGDNRTAIMAALSALARAAGVAGRAVVGSVTNTLAWKAISWLTLRLMLVAAGLLLAPGAKDAAAADRHRIDWPGLVLLAAFMTALIVGLQALPKAASSPAAAAVPLLIALAALAALLAVEARTAPPLVPLG